MHFTGNRVSFRVGGLVQPLPFPIMKTLKMFRLLKAKLARYRAQLLEPTSKSGPAGQGFDVQKSGGNSSFTIFNTELMIRLILGRCASGPNRSIPSLTTLTFSYSFPQVSPALVNLPYFPKQPILVIFGVTYLISAIDAPRFTQRLRQRRTSSRP